MNPRNIFQLEVLNTAGNIRAMLMKITFSLLLFLPFLIFGIPLKIKIYGIVIILLFTSFFGSAISVVRRKTEGHVMKLRLMAFGRFEIVTDYILSMSLIDIFQMLIPYTLFLMINLSTLNMTLLVQLYFLYISTIIFFNTLGLLLGFAMKTNAEVHLAGVFCTGLLIGFSDIVTFPHKLYYIFQAIAGLNPVTYVFRGFTSIILDNNLIPANPVFIIMAVILILIFFLWRSLNLN